MELSRGLLLLLVGVLLVTSAMLVMPFIEYFLLALLLAYLLVPVQKRLETRVRPRVAAGSIVAVASVVIVLPLVYAVRAAVGEVVSLLRAIRAGEISLAETESEIRELTGVTVDLSSVLQSVFGGVQFNNVVSAFGALTHALIGVGLTLFLLYYFLKDREDFLQWFNRTAPLSDDVRTRLYDEIDTIMAAVLVGHIFIAVVQGTLAGLGLMATGVPNATFWTVIMVVLSLLPIVGSFLVWGPAVIYLFAGAQPAMAVALFLWGAVVVGVSDDYLRPIVVDRYAHVNPSVIIIGVVGGVYVIGFMGIFFGPVIIGALRATLDVFREEFGTDR